MNKPMLFLGNVLMEIGFMSLYSFLTLESTVIRSLQVAGMNLGLIGMLICWIGWSYPEFGSEKKESKHD